MQGEGCKVRGARRRAQDAGGMPDCITTQPTCCAIQLLKTGINYFAVIIFTDFITTIIRFTMIDTDNIRITIRRKLKSRSN